MTQFQHRDPILEVQHLSTEFDLRAGRIKSVNGVSFDIRPGEILGLVGESGSGKSLTGLSIMGLVPKPGYIAGGQVLVENRDITALREEDLRPLRGRKISMIFQDPTATLNPVLTIGRQFHEVLSVSRRIGWRESQHRGEKALAEVGIPAPQDRLKSYPHELSGGMRQRVCIALSLIHHPQIVIADEPTTALDVTIQAQILNLVQKLVAERDMALIWITHDLSVVAGLCDRVAVMYGGRIVEIGPVEQVLETPRHPYTRGLLGSIPGTVRPGQPLTQISGTQPSPLALPSGCAFRTRCPVAQDVCLDKPKLTIVENGHLSRCHFALAGDLS